MDEILIEEKKYVSSKQAAKVTGYAKDYIGQLCREGRVPARLVGRSWYVLESAIHDHRFGNPHEPTERKESTPLPLSKPSKGSSVAPFQSSREAPHYETFKTEILPPINRLQEKESSEHMDEHKDTETARHLHDTWQSWFDRFDHVKDTAVVEEPEEKQEEKEEEKEIEENTDVQIPIHAVYQSPPEELSPRRHVADGSPGNVREVQTKSKGAVRVIQSVLIGLAALVATVAAIGSGYFDKYIISDSRVSLIGGISVYNK